MNEINSSNLESVRKNGKHRIIACACAQKKVPKKKRNKGKRFAAKKS